MVFDVERQVSILFGGLDQTSGQSLADTWAWDGAVWRPEHPAKEPPGRIAHAAAYDQAHGQVVLFGGETTLGGDLSAGTGNMSDTWTWNGQDWSLQATAGGPTARVGASATYDRARKLVLLFGGAIGLGYGLRPVNDTWSWDGKAWTQQHPISSPLARGSAAMAYDDARAEVVLFGGLSARKEVLADTWTWNGTAWRLEPLVRAPAGREGAVMAYDAARQQLVLFGGTGDGGSFDDTWTWDGKAWVEQHPKSSPPAQCCDAGTYDSARKVVVLFNDKGQTWTWDGTNWTEQPVAP